MAREQISELPELLRWLEETIEPIRGEQWQITLNSSGAVVEATAKIVTSHTERPNQTCTISRTTKAKFRLAGLTKWLAFRSD